MGIIYLLLLGETQPGGEERGRTKKAS